MNGVVMLFGWIIAFWGMASDKTNTILFGIAVLLVACCGVLVQIKERLK